MITLVISGGDSFTFGSELLDDCGTMHVPVVTSTPYHRPTQPIRLGPFAAASKHSWANLTANKLNAKHINTGESGRSNSYIVRHIINIIYEALEHNYKPDEIFVQVMWTFVARQEIAVNFDIKRYDSPWFAVDPYVCEDETKSNWFKKVSKSVPNWQEVHDDMHKRYLINKDLGLVDYAKSYYTVVSDLHDKYTSLQKILMLQDFLESRNVKYMFTYVNEHVMKGLISIDKFTNGLHSFIKFDEWFKFPGDKEFMGFDDWAKANGYPYATSHPLEQAHKDAAELLYEKAKQIITGSVGPIPGE